MHLASLAWLSLISGGLMLTSPAMAQEDGTGFEFKFQGGPPGWEVLGLPATVESMVLVSPDGKSVIQELHQAIEAGSNEGELFD